MLYLHGGWPRTSTSVLQAALFEHRDRLASAGLTYPDRWRLGDACSHHGLSRLLDGSEDGVPLAEFSRFLADHADRDVLLSAEGFTGWLLSDDRREAIVRLMAVGQEVMPVRWVWTLRRFDETFESFYLLALRWGCDLSRLTGYLDNADLQDALFRGMRAVGDAAEQGSVFVGYDSRGMHNRELLRVFGVPADIEAGIAAEIERGPRLYPSLRHKEAVALANREALSARAGVELGAADLLRAFAQQGFRFDGDGRCVLLDRSTKVAMHERALAAGRREGLTAYAAFFADAEIDSSSIAGLSAELLDDDDLKRLVDHLDLARSGGG